MNKNNLLRNGFSLVELLVVISIIATLTAIILPNLMGTREKARDSQRIQDLNGLRTALRMYYNDNQAYPTPVVMGGGGTLGVGFSGYFPAVSNLGYTYEYYQTNNGDGFITCVNLEGNGGPDATYSQNKCGVSTSGLDVCHQGVNTVTQKVYTVCAN